METYDLKPEAPVEYRGELRPISTVVPGMDICELLPEHAKVADKLVLIRSRIDSCERVILQLRIQYQADITA